MQHNIPCIAESVEFQSSMICMYYSSVRWRLIRPILFQACRKQIDRYKPAYVTLKRAGQSLLQKSHGLTAQNVSELMRELDSTWCSLLDEGEIKVRELRNSLEAWEQYTERMEKMMSWLRDVEKIVRCSLADCTVEQIQEQLVKCQVQLLHL